MGGAHSAYRLSPIHKDNVCIFERENYVGGRAYDLDYKGNIPDAYSTTPISPLGSIRFYKGQPVMKELIDELNITYYPYDYQTQLIKARGQLYTSYNEMCTKSYVNLTCTDDSDGNNPPDQLWLKLLDAYETNPKDLYKYADVNAFCRALFGDEATEYLRDSFRFRADFHTDVYSYLEYLKQEWNLVGTIYYPFNGLSQVVKRMIYKSTKINKARLYLNEEVLRIDEVSNSFLIETTNYKVYCKQLIITIPPAHWTNIHGTIANEIKSSKQFQAILPVTTVVINNYWSERWWEKTSLTEKIVDRAWTSQNCINFIEILSRHPEKMNQNVTRSVYDDGLCTDVWSALVNRSSNRDLIDELLRGLRSIYTDVTIPSPKKTQVQIWHGAWHLQRRNSQFTNKDIARWALRPLKKFNKNQITLVGEAYNIDRSGWSDGAIKSSLMSLYSQFNFKKSCYQNDQAVEGEYCSNMFI
ncbi:hypothetical protein I4U23_005014 [Adineta vaga]|nr:hypothetical protein I4U23_005014 [Adineta vaga]